MERDKIVVTNINYTINYSALIYNDVEIKLQFLFKINSVMRYIRANQIKRLCVNKTPSIWTTIPVFLWIVLVESTILFKKLVQY